MEHGKRLIQTYIPWLLDMICLYAVYHLASYIRFAGPGDWGDRNLHYMIGTLFLLYGTVYTFITDWNKDILLRGYYQEFAAVFRFMVSMILVVMTFVYLMRWAYILSRFVILFYAFVSPVLMYAVHTLYKFVLHRLFSNEQLVSRVFVVAQGKDLENTIRRLISIPNMYYRIVGAAYVEEPGEETPDVRHLLDRNVPVFVVTDKLTKKMTQMSFDEVFINTPDLPQKQAAAMIDGFEEMGVDVHYGLDLPSIGQARSSVGMFGDYSVVTYARYRRSDAQFLLKRLMDIAGGLVGVLITAVLTLFIAPAIKLTSPGPVFFSQIRVGRNGRRFRIYKFRSMVQDAEEKKAELESQNEMNGLMFKLENDPRVTKVGAFLRKTSLDEFPQFFNVLKGDMSLVGTRPPTEEEFEQYNEHYRRRISMRPGLTGLWQVSGRSNIADFDEVVRLDLQYIDHWSIQQDVKILAQTIVVVLFGKGAR